MTNSSNQSNGDVNIAEFIQIQQERNRLSEEQEESIQTIEQLRNNLMVIIT